jgi:hypothetical protein
MGGNDDENGRECGVLDWIEAESIESLPPSSARSAGGRASKHQHVGGDEISLNITHLGVLTRASKNLNMNDDELFDYFFACLQGSEMPMACASMECEFLSILLDENCISSGSGKNPSMIRI